LEVWVNHKTFQSAVKLTPQQQRDATAEECVLRFFAFFYQYKKFDHNVTDFLNNYMKSATLQFDYAEGMSIFSKTFDEIARVFPGGIRRPERRSTTPLILFEGITVGAAHALQKVKRLSSVGIDKWMKSPELRNFTTGATNSRSAVVGRIEFCRDRFLGKPYVPSPPA
jgi:hypothetical protein